MSYICGRIKSVFDPSPIGSSNNNNGSEIDINDPNSLINFPHHGTITPKNEDIISKHIFSCCRTGNHQFLKKILRKYAPPFFIPFQEPSSGSLLTTSLSLSTTVPSSSSTLHNRANIFQKLKSPSKSVIFKFHSLLCKQNEFGRTCLNYCCRNGHMKCFKLLIPFFFSREYPLFNTFTHFSKNLLESTRGIASSQLNFFSKRIKKNDQTNQKIKRLQLNVVFLKELFSNKSKWNILHDLCFIGNPNPIIHELLFDIFNKFEKVGSNDDEDDDIDDEPPKGDNEYDMDHYGLSIDVKLLKLFLFELISCSTSFGSSPIHIAIKKGNFKSMKLFITFVDNYHTLRIQKRSGYLVNVGPVYITKWSQMITKRKHTILHVTCQAEYDDGYLTEKSKAADEIIKFWKNHFSISVQEQLVKTGDTNKNSLLHCMCYSREDSLYNGLKEIINYYKPKDIRKIIRTPDRLGNTPLHYALYSNSYKCAILILSKSFRQSSNQMNISEDDSDEDYDFNNSSEDYDSDDDYDECIFNIRNNKGHTPLHIACSEIRIDLLKKLFTEENIQKYFLGMEDVDLKIKDRYHKTCLDLCREMFKKDVFEIFFKFEKIIDRITRQNYKLDEEEDNDDEDEESEESEESDDDEEMFSK